MSLLKPITNLIVKILEAGSGPENHYQIVDENRAGLSAEQVLEIIAPIIQEENAGLKEQLAQIYPARPVLQEDSQTEHRIWLVSCFYTPTDGESADKQTEYCWFLVDDQTGEVREKIFPH